jgi:hypothetical protein
MKLRRRWASLPAKRARAVAISARGGDQLVALAGLDPEIARPGGERDHRRAGRHRLQVGQPLQSLPSLHGDLAAPAGLERLALERRNRRDISLPDG